jgi:rhodanese-related sulfurtransferase/molybdopterin-guanine dinucleotide biosynthesis protein A
MGADKAFVVVDGRPMVIAVADALWEAGCSPVECQGGDVVALSELGLRVEPDGDSGAGPVAAIAVASERIGGPIVVAACDLPNLDSASVRAVVAAGEAAGRTAVATADGRHHLLLYVPAGAAADFRADASVADVLRGVGAIEVPVDPTALRNVNTPADVEPPVDAARRETGPVASVAMAIQEITVDQLAELLEQGARLVDVREPSEYADARVPNGTLVPLADVPDHLDAFPEDSTTYVICRSGARSMRACEFVAAHGREAVNVAGGTLAWIESGRQVDRGA